MEIDSERDYEKLLKKSDDLVKRSARLQDKCIDESSLLKELIEQSERLVSQGQEEPVPPAADEESRRG